MRGSERPSRVPSPGSDERKYIEQQKRRKHNGVTQYKSRSWDDIPLLVPLQGSGVPEPPGTLTTAEFNTGSRLASPLCYILQVRADARVRVQLGGRGPVQRLPPPRTDPKPCFGPDVGRV